MDSDRHSTARVFISATSGDLGSLRQVVKEGLLTMGCMPVEQTNFPPDYRSVAEMIVARVGECDAVVHLVGMRYGAEPEPATLPAGTARRSYTQMEADIARRMKKKLYLFVCPEDFPYDQAAPETEEKAALQRAYREEVGRSETLRTRVADHQDMAQRVRELQVDLENIRKQLARERRQRLVLTCVVALLLVGLGGGVWWNSRHTLQVVESIAQDYAPEKIEANLRKRIRERAEEETRKLDPVKDWRKVVEIEKTRDQQLGDVDRLLEEMHAAYEKQEVSANYALASKILADQGVEETLQFLAAKNGEREERIAALTRQRSGVENELRKVLNEKLLAASLFEKNLQFDQAEGQYRAVLAADPSWAEPRVALAELLIRRGEVVEPEKGNALLREAVGLCREALALTPQARSPLEWSTMQNDLGSALKDQSERAGGTEGARLLAEAVTAYRAALEVRTREQVPEDWAFTQNNLATVLRDQSERAAGAEGSRLLAEAVAAYRAALEVRTREQFPQDWALTETNLGIALADQSERATGTEATRLLAEAVAAYRAALQVRTRERVPQDWALTQINLGLALTDQGGRAGGADGERLLAEAAAIFREVLQVWTREQVPQQWAKTQNNLGNVLAIQGERTAGAEGERLLGEAVAAHRATLQVYTREQLPQDWARTQSNLGNALMSQGERAGSGQAGGPSPTGGNAEGSRLLAEAVTALREALQVYTREQWPQDWARTQNNLGIALTASSRAGGEAGGPRLLGEAAAAFRAALQVRTREQLPQDWATTQNNLAITLSDQGWLAWTGHTGESADGPRLLGDAVAAYRAALEVRTREQLPQEWAMTQINLGNALLRQAVAAEEAAAPPLLGDAVAAYRQALEVFTRERSTYYWTTAEQNLSITLKAAATLSTGSESEKFQAEAAAIDRELAGAEGK